MFAINYKRTITFLSVFMLSFSTLHAQNYPAVFDQNSLNGKNGFIVRGIHAGDALGTEISFIGDLNHDGLEDIAINTEAIKPNGLELGGTTYIIFGSKNPYPSPFDLTTLNGSNGFKVEGIAADERRGKSIGKLGDINGDGIDDIALSSQGEKHMFLYGRTTGFPASMTINDINTSNGFIFTEDGVGEIKGAGDVNGDGMNDIIIGQYAWSGHTYILFGRSSNFPLNVDPGWLDGTRGFYLDKVAANISAFYVGAAGDINADGYDDVMVGIWSGPTDGEGLTYVYFGHAAPFQSKVDLKAVNGTNGFAIQNASDYTLVTVGTVGDINGDGIDDCFSRNNIIYGSKSPFAQKFISNGTNGFSSTGFNQTSAAIGDVNMDGIDDFMVVSNNNENWIVYGSKTFPAVFDPSVLNGTGGFKIKNISQSNIGRQISGKGDINGDGLSDFMIGGEDVGYNSNTGKGVVFVVFGGDHYAMPLKTGYPNVADISHTSFGLQVNIPEKGNVHYAIYKGTQSTVTNTASILNGTGALQHGNIQVPVASAIIDKPITGLTLATKYDVYLYFEDAARNIGAIYFLNDVTTLTDTEKPVITCPGDHTLACGALLPNYTLTVAVTDNVDSKPKVTQSPAEGSVFYTGMTVTITALDNAGNKSNCTFKIDGQQIVLCPENQLLQIGTLLPDYTKGITTTGFCTSSVTVSQSPLPGTLVEEGVTRVTLLATDANQNSAKCTFVINDVATDVQGENSFSPVKFYPNPVNDMLYIEGVSHTSYEIIDNVGSVVGAGTDSSTIRFAGLSSGMYVVLLYNTEHKIVDMKKIIKN